MNVALVTFYRLNEAAGVTTFVSRLQESLRDRGHLALVLEPGDEDRIGPTPGSTYPARYAVNLGRLRAQRGSPLKAFLAFWVYLPLSLYDLWSFLRRERVQVIHLHFPIPAALYFCALRAVSSWSLVVTFHGSDIYTLGRRSWLYRMLLRIALARVDLVTAVSGDVLRAVKAAFPRLRVSSRAILNGKPLEQASPSGVKPGALSELTQPYALAVGSLIVRKGYDVLIRALRIARDGGRDVRLVIVGEGSEDRTLADLSRELDVDDLVLFAGEVPHSDISSYYAAARFFVHSAREEAQGLVLLEAMACGKAVIATRVNGIPELVRHGETGLLVESDDPSSLAAAIIRLCEEPALCDSLGLRGQEIVLRDHSWDNLTDQYLDAYGQAINRH
jgi:glycosyltransferase involved in cell wall biosynthesis